MLRQVHHQQRAVAQRAVPLQRHGAIRVAAPVHGAAGAVVAKAMQHTVARRRWQRQERALRKGIALRSGADAASTEAPKPPAPKAFLPGAQRRAGTRWPLVQDGASSEISGRPQMPVPATGQLHADAAHGVAAPSQPHWHAATCTRA